MDDAFAGLSSALEARYALLGEIGHGGMAVVLLAEDLKHHRRVALKVLRPELAAILGGDRFLKEIEVTANLQHPNILPLYDSGQAGGFLYYVMPLVEGESLRARLDREHQLPVDEVVEVVRCVAAALDHAHHHDILHRDIKPSNILLVEGQALVADFGVALAMRRAGGVERLTKTGLSVGTPHYMSPEQAAGDQEMDARSDVYSLGATTYEMLVGEPPHAARTPQAVIARILSETPAPIRRTRDLVPENVEAAVAKALARSPADRFGSAGEFAAALTNPAFRLPTATAASVQAGGVKAWNRVGPATAVVAVVATLVAAWSLLRPGPSALPVARFGLAFPEGQEPIDQRRTSFDVARGAGVIVYVGPGEGGTALWVKHRNRLNASMLPGTEGASLPSISPDGREVAFLVGTQLRKLSIAGGGAATVAEPMGPASIAWGGDGTLLYSDANAYHLQRIPAGGGVPEDVWPDCPEGTIAGYPVALPDPEALIFTLGPVGWSATDLWVLDLRSGEARLLVPEALRAWYLDSGHLVFVRRDGTVFSAPFDLRSLELKAPAVLLLEGVKVEGIYPDLALATDGTLLMLPGTSDPPDREMVWVSRGGDVDAVDTTWRYSSARNSGFALSPDGGRLAIGIHTDEGDDIWIKELDGGPLLRLTTAPAEDEIPGWTPDGQSVYFASARAGNAQLYVQRADGAGSPLLLVSHPRNIEEADMSGDGKWVAIRVGGSTGQRGGRDVYGYRLDADTGRIPLLTSDYDEVSPHISPDGRWLAYASDESGALEVYVRPFPDVESGRWVVSRGGGSAPLWAHSGRELFYVSAGRTMVAAGVEARDRFRVTVRDVLFAVPDDIVLGERTTVYDVTPDDRRFIMMRQVHVPRVRAIPILVENWGQEVEEALARQGR